MRPCFWRGTLVDPRQALIVSDVPNSRSSRPWRKYGAAYLSYGGHDAPGVLAKLLR